MTLLTRYDTPAGLRDVPDDSPFYDAWHDTVAGLVSGGGGHWFDPLVSDAEVIGPRMLSWMGFPRQFMTVEHRDDRERAFDVVDPDRENQPEYFEWNTFRGAAGKVTKVVFVTETPEYWGVLAETEPDRVVSLYQELLHPDVQKSDLFENETYNGFNRWNTTDGIVHFVSQSPVNSLGAAIGLARRGAANTAVSDNYSIAAAGPPHSVDDYINLDVGAVARKGHFITVQDPAGLYIDGWDDTGWTKPDGTPVGDYWRVTRGHPGAALRLEYEVPAAEGFVVGDIEIGGRPVTHGGQLAEHISLALPVLVARSLS